MEFDQERIDAIYKAESWYKTRYKPIFEIAGAAGTGKTTLASYIAERLGLKKDNVLYVAFMGKAATCLSRNGLPASTIHSTIYDYEKVIMRTGDGKILYNEWGKPKKALEKRLKPMIPKCIKLIILDEAGMVPQDLAIDLISFDIPVIALGDLNQLEPVMGKSYFLKTPDVILHKVMRQAEDSPIIYLSQTILDNRQLRIGIYDNCSVIPKRDLSEAHFLEADAILTQTNKLRGEINTMFRSKLKNFNNMDIPHIGEKIICRKNNWGKHIGDVFLTNGLSGYIDYCDMGTYKNDMINIDFRADFLEKPYKNLTIDFNTLMSQVGSKDNSNYMYWCDVFEFGYAITTHLSQGSQWDNVLLIVEDINFPKDYMKRLLYTGITRAIKKITIAI